MYSIIVSFLALVVISSATTTPPPQTTQAPQTTTSFNVTSVFTNCSNADAQCEKEFPGSRLASIHSEAEHQLAVATMYGYGENYVWLGLQNDGEQWQWVDGSSFDYGSNISGGVWPWMWNKPDVCDPAAANPLIVVECCTYLNFNEWMDDNKNTYIMFNDTKYIVSNETKRLSMCRTGPTPSPTLPSQSPVPSPTTLPSQSPVPSPTTLPPQSPVPSPTTPPFTTTLPPFQSPPSTTTTSSDIDCVEGDEWSEWTKCDQICDEEEPGLKQRFRIGDIAAQGDGTPCSYPIQSQECFIPCITFNVTSVLTNCSNADAQCEKEFPGSRSASIHSFAELQLAVAALHSYNEIYAWIALQNDGEQWQWDDGTAFDYGSNVSGGVWPWGWNQPNDCNATNSVECCTYIDWNSWEDVDKSTQSRKYLAMCRTDVVVDCVEGTWSDWSECDAECGEGTHQRVRSGDIAAQGLGTPCSDTIQTQVCVSPCTVTFSITEAQTNCSHADDLCTSEFPDSRSASIHSAGEMALALAATEEYGTDYAWIGLQNNGEEWQWDDGSVFDYGSNVSGGVYPWMDISTGRHHPFYCDPADSGSECCTMIADEGWTDWDMPFFQGEKQHVMCRTDVPDVDCVEGTGGEWSECKSLCDDVGTQQRIRSGDTAAQGSGKPCNNTTEIQPCVGGCFVNVESPVAVVGLFAFLTFLCCFCSVFGVCLVVICIVLNCLRGKKEDENIVNYSTENAGTYVAANIGDYTSASENAGNYTTENVGDSCTLIAGDYTTENAGNYMTEKGGNFVDKNVDDYDHDQNSGNSMDEKGNNYIDNVDEKFKADDKAEPEVIISMIEMNNINNTGNEQKAKVILCIYYILWFLLFLPLKAMAFGCGKIFSCHGCSVEVAKRFFSFLPNLISTIIILSRFGASESGIDFEQAAADGVSTFFKVDPKVVQGLAIIILVLIGFIMKAKDVYTSHRVAKDQESEIVKSYQIKNLQALIITSSDTLFKVFSGLAIIVGSDYAGTDGEGMESDVVSYIKGAAIIGAVQEFIDMAEEYLTKSFMFATKKKEVGKFSCEFSAKTVSDQIESSISDKLNVDSLEPGEPAQSSQKIILWNALWAGSKLFMLFVEQLLAFIAAVILAASGDVIGFLIIVIICCFGDILLAGVMCTKYQRLSVGLFCKYYFCCFYNQCIAHCENHWIKLDPIENGLKFNVFGGVMPAQVETVEMAVISDKGPFIYKASYSTGVYGSYVLKHSYTIPFVYKASYSTGVYGSYVLKNSE